MQRSCIVFLFLFLGLVRAGLQNVTVDDTSPQIVYSGATFHCNATNACGVPDDAGIFNQTATFTSEPVSFNFTGVAIYATMDVLGVVSVILDGEVINVFSNTLANLTNVTDNVVKTDLTNAPHSLLITPNSIPLTIIGLDQLVYTISVPDKHNHVGAIVGGVIGGLALICGMLFAALFARRRKLILRRNQRKSAVLRGIDAARIRRNQTAPGEEDAKELPPA